MNGFARSLKICSRILFFAFFSVYLLCLGAFAFIRAGIDKDADRELFLTAKSTSVTHFYANASRTDTYEPIEVDKTAFGNEAKVWYPMEEISDYLRLGFIAVEDREFYTHGGVNFRRTLGAVLNYIAGGERYGASTITQQVVKNISGDDEISPLRKAREIVRAMLLEEEYSKDEILEMYMNIAPMSANIAGVGYAAERFFGKEPSELTLAEAATVVGVTNSPARFDPWKNPEACTQRRNYVLDAMRACGYISDEELLAAKSEELCVRENDGGVRSWFVETVIEDITADLARKLSLSKSAARLVLMKGGYNVYMTERVWVQEALDEYFSKEENLPGEVKNGLGIAMCVCDSKSGELVGIVGSGGKKSASGILNLADVPHPPASTLKPLALYAPLLNEGKITWSTLIDDSPTEYIKSGDEEIPYPKNSPDKYEGLITVADALKRSKNTVAMRLYAMRGAEEIFTSLVRDFGFDTLVKSKKLDTGATLTDIAPAPLALGQLSYGVTLRRLTEAYTVFASMGVKHSPRSYLTVTDKDGHTVLEAQGTERRVLSKECAQLVNQMLMNVVADGTAKRIKLKYAVDTAGKTGTSAGERDRLFVGYTPYFTAGIWCGYPDKSEPTGALSPSHLEMWDTVMHAIHADMPTDLHFPTDGLVIAQYCKKTGLLATDDCLFDSEHGTARGYYIKGTEPVEYCPHVKESSPDTPKQKWQTRQKVPHLPLYNAPIYYDPRKRSSGKRRYL